MALDLDRVRGRVSALLLFVTLRPKASPFSLDLWTLDSGQPLSTSLRLLVRRGLLQPHPFLYQQITMSKCHTGEQKTPFNLLSFKEWVS